jgi:hypothetical protein
MANTTLQTKPYVNYIGGLWTESSPLNFPENTSQIEQNFKINPDGTRERRLGLQEIVNNEMVKDMTTRWVFHSYRWLDANNANNSVYMVTQVGRYIHFYEESTVCHSDYTWKFSIDLQQYAVNEASIWDYPVSFASGMGKLFIAHKAIQPIYVTYNQGGICKDKDEGWIVTVVQLYERDFDGVDDGLAIDEHPTTLSQEHLYNLLNQGWTMEYIKKYFDQAKQLCITKYTNDNDPATDPATCVGEYPSNNEIWYLGFYTDPADGIEKWSVEELRKSSIGAARAPRGHFIRNVFDTCDYFEKLTDIRIIAANPVYKDGSDDYLNRIRIVFSVPHNFVNGDTFTIVGSSYTHTNSTGSYSLSYDGTYTIGTNAFAAGDDLFVEITVNIPNLEDGISVLVVNSPGAFVYTSTSESALPKIPCCVDRYRPEVVSFYAGRVWYGGIDSRRIGNKIYFSQVLTDDTKIGKMYQEYDPTSEEFNELLKTDGGVIDMPELGWLKAMEELKDSLILFVDNGIWSISGGEIQYFTATSYSISKLTDVGCIAKKSVKPVEDTFVFASDRGIYLVSPDTRITNISEEAIHNRYRKIPSILKQQIDICYNTFDKTLHIFHGLNPALNVNKKPVFNWKYCSELVLNHRVKAWYEYKYPSSIIVGAAQTGESALVPNHIMYFANISSKATPCYMSNCKFIDFVGTTEEQDAPAYFLSSPDSLGELMVDKEVKEICFFLDNEAETEGLFQGMWDFACHECSGGITAAQEIFKPKKVCEKVYPFRSIRTDLKVKGKGRAFELAIASVPTKPLKIHGWAIKYEGVPER